MGTSGSTSMLRRSVVDLRAIANHFVQHAPRFGGRVGLLVEGALRYGLMRMVSAWMDHVGIDAQVSRRQDLLMAWLLGGPPPSD